MPTAPEAAAPITTLVMTVWNREATLAEAIDSALAQSFEAFELLIWDDGSTDGSLGVAERYAARDPRVRVIAAPHQGRVAALNAAVAATHTDSFGILDSDDRLRPEALAATLPVLQADPDIALVYTNCDLMDERGRVTGPAPGNALTYSPEALLVSQMVFHFRLFRREIFDEVGGFDPAFESAEDYDLVIRLSEAGEIVHVPRTLYDYRVHAASLSAEGDLAQIRWSQRAVENALVRRGVADRLKLNVRLHATFTLAEREPAKG